MASAHTGKVLLVLDLQHGIVSRVPDSSAFLAQTAKTINAAREHSIPVIYVTVNFRPGYPEVSSRNKMFSTTVAAAGDAFEEGKPAVQIPAEIAPTEKDILVSKRRVSAFSGSDLDVVLRGLGAETLIITGIATSGAVLSTVRHAADQDFFITVLNDLCFDLDEEVHRVLVEKVFPKQGEVVSSDSWIKSLRFANSSNGYKMWFPLTWRGVSRDVLLAVVDKT
ncbi:isochorismatase family protein [Paecilomyces variotii No. 5]|uniref:Isochorismatase family protein n=1 Tax=Byssochlamys spectabilis (strain No. 5 / NBRC 109023) TaxID=1356009 RepID=V5FQ46_BYSSN|nr:isochorismatase family protein [Paecilomyces variotii No. 5]